MAEEKKINAENNQPNLELQKELSDVINKATSSVVVRGKVWRVKDMYPGTKRKFTSIFVDKNQKEDTIACKAAAVFRLSGMWKIKFFYWFLWRWYFYIMEYTDAELLPFIEECKKKVGHEDYLKVTMSLTAMKDTMMNQTREEVERIRVELLTEQLSRLEKSTQS